VAQVKSVSELNKLKVRLFVEAVLNEGQLELIDDLVAVDYIGHISCVGTVVAGPQGVRQLVSSRRQAHPGLHVKIEDLFAEDDRVVTRWRATATGPGARSVGAAARQVSCCAGISIIRLLAGKQVDARTQCTNLTSQPAAGRRDSSELPCSDFRQ
jgi:predicted ester cyclase